MLGNMIFEKGQLLPNTAQISTLANLWGLYNLSSRLANRDLDPGCDATVAGLEP